METLSDVNVYRNYLSRAECEMIKKAMLRHREKEGNSLMWHFGNAYYVLHQLFKFSKNGQVCEFYDKDKKFLGIMLFDVGQLWWSEEAFLIEQFVLCVQPDYHGFQRLAIQKLNALARQFNVKAICGGCLFQDNPQMVINGYRKDGFNIDSPSVFKVMKDTPTMFKVVTEDNER